MKGCAWVRKEGEKEVKGGNEEEGGWREKTAVNFLREGEEEQLGVKKGGRGQDAERRVIEMVMVGKVADSPRTWKRK